MIAERRLGGHGMRARAFVGCACLVLVALGAGAAAAEAEDDEQVPVAFCIVPEMEGVAEVDEWAACKPDAFAEEAAKALADWKKKLPWVKKQVTPELARRLSRWAKKEMEGYQAVPPLEKVALKPVSHDETHGKLVLEGTVDTLPSHSPIVTRWLKLFLLCDKGSGTVQRVTVTIRGQVLE